MVIDQSASLNLSTHPRIVPCCPGGGADSGGGRPALPRPRPRGGDLDRCGDPGHRDPERVTVIEFGAARGLGHEVVPARDFDDAWLTSRALGRAARPPATAGTGGSPAAPRPRAERVVPYLFPSAERLHGPPFGRPPHFMPRLAHTAMTRRRSSALEAGDDPTRHPCRAYRGGPHCHGHAQCVRADATTGSPRDEVGVRRVVLPQQRGDRRTGVARRRLRESRCHRHRRTSRQRHPGDLRRAARCVHGLRARRPWRSLVPAPRRLRRRDRARHRIGRISRCRLRWAPATRCGSRPSSAPHTLPLTLTSLPSWSPSGWMPLSTIPRVRCR